MFRHMVATLGLLGLTAIAGSGCILFQTGSANTEGSIGGREVYLGGTVVSWWDTTMYEVNDDGQQIKQTRESEEQLFHLRMYGFMFNPREDRRFWSWQQKAEFSYNLSRYDSLSLVVAESGSLSNSARLEYNSEEPPSPGDGPYLVSISFTTAPVKVNETNEYPDTVKEYGSRMIFVLEVATVEREPGKECDGSFQLNIEKSDDDESGVVTGSIKGDFKAPVLYERIAECNFGTDATIDGCDDLEADGENP